MNRDLYPTNINVPVHLWADREKWAHQTRKEVAFPTEFQGSRNAAQDFYSHADWQLHFIVQEREDSHTATLHDADMTTQNSSQIYPS